MAGGQTERKEGSEKEGSAGQGRRQGKARPFSTDTQDDGGMALPLVFQREFSAEFDPSSPTLPLYTELSVLLWFIYKTSVC